MKVIPYLAEQLGNHLAGGVEFSAMKALVHDIERSDMSGSEKKNKVLEDFEAIGYSLAGWIIDTILQLAVVVVKSKLA